MKVKLVRRWGPHSANQTVEVDDTQGEWLIRHNYAESSGDVQAPEQQAAAEGTHGADPLAGADGTRRRPRSIRSNREKSDGPIAAAEGSSPAYRGGFTSEDAERQGEAGRNYREGSDKRAGQLSAAEGSPYAEGPRAGDGSLASPAQQDAQGSQKPRRSRSKSDS